MSGFSIHTFLVGRGINMDSDEIKNGQKHHEPDGAHADDQHTGHGDHPHSVAEGKQQGHQQAGHPVADERGVEPEPMDPMHHGHSSPTAQGEAAGEHTEHHPDHTARTGPADARSEPMPHGAMDHTMHDHGMEHADHGAAHVDHT